MNETSLFGDYSQLRVSTWQPSGTSLSSNRQLQTRHYQGRNGVQAVAIAQGPLAFDKPRSCWEEAGPVGDCQCYKTNRWTACSHPTEKQSNPKKRTSLPWNKTQTWLFMTCIMHVAKLVTCYITDFPTFTWCEDICLATWLPSCWPISYNLQNSTPRKRHARAAPVNDTNRVMLRHRAESDVKGLLSSCPSGVLDDTENP